MYYNMVGYLLLYVTVLGTNIVCAKIIMYDSEGEGIYNIMSSNRGC